MKSNSNIKTFESFLSFLNENKTNSIEDIISDLVESYLQTADWVENDTPLYSYNDEQRNYATEQISNFVSKVIEKFGGEKAYEILSITNEKGEYITPYFFYLNRNGHGTGFWDAEKYYNEEDCNILDKISKDIGSDDYFTIEWLEDDNDNDN